MNNYLYTKERSKKDNVYIDDTVKYICRNTSTHESKNKIFLDPHLTTYRRMLSKYKFKMCTKRYDQFIKCKDGRHLLSRSTRYKTGRELCQCVKLNSVKKIYVHISD